MRIRTNSTHKGIRGLSLPEMLAVLAILGILTFLAISHYGGMTTRSKATIATDLREKLNSALKGFSQVNYEPNLARNDNSTDDEYLILRSLQWRDPVNPDPGAPFFMTDYSPATSDSIEDFRLIWNGKVFKLLEPGDAGEGLLVSFDGSDTTAYTFPDDFSPVGP